MSVGIGVGSPIGSFVIGESPIGYELIGAPYSMLQTVIPAYLYVQYADDPTLPAFFQAANVMVQQYVDWFNQISLPIWTSPLLIGPVLDWVATGLYGVPRPVLTTVSATVTGPIATYPIAAQPIGSYVEVASGTTTTADDDIYKRVLTWNLYAGDGKQFSVTWLKRRIARFLYGVNGFDPGIQQTYDISVVPSPGHFAITLPAGPVSSILAQAFANGVLSLPFQYTYAVTVA